MYDKVITNVRIQGGVTKDSPIKIDLHQGSSLNPYRFTLVLNILTRHIQYVVPKCILFTYDIVLINELQENVNCRYGKKF